MYDVFWDERDYEKMLFDCYLGIPDGGIYGCIDNDLLTMLIHTTAMEDIVVPCISVYAKKTDTVLGSLIWEWEPTDSYKQLLDDLDSMVWEMEDYILEMDDEQN